MQKEKYSSAWHLVMPGDGGNSAACSLPWTVWCVGRKVLASE